MTNDLERVDQNNDIKRTYYKSNRFDGQAKITCIELFYLIFNFNFNFPDENK